MILLITGRGMNVEVSMPTGSLCSERAAIASALASDPSLSRRHFKLIAVLSHSLQTPSTAMLAAAAASSSSSSSASSLLALSFY
jgi:cytidine deaminase